MSAVLDPREALTRRLTKRAIAGVVLPTLAALVPFLPWAWWIWLFFGLAGGVAAGLMVRRARKLTSAERVAERYQKAVIPDCMFTNQTFVGMGMEFAQYREAFDRATQEKGRLSPEEHKALHESLVRQMIPIYISDDDLTRHVFTVASTGLGKTELFQSVILPSVIKRGSGCLIYDAKGDEKLITSIYAMAREFHREEDVLFINFNKPEYSHTYNPLLFGNTRQVVSSLMKLFDKHGQQFFRDIARAALTSALLAIKGQKTPIAFNFMDLNVLFSNYYELEKLFQSMAETNEDRATVWSFLLRFHGTDSNGNKFIDTKRYAEWLTGLSNKMLDFAHSEYKRILNDYSPDIELKSAILHNKIIVVVIPALSDKEGVELFGKLFMADFARAVGQIQEDRLKPSPPFFAFLDEYPSFADETHLELFQQARSANITLWPAVQGHGFMAKVAPYFGDNLATNCWHHIYFDIRDPNSRDYALKLAGKTVRRYKTESDSENFGYSHENIQTGAKRMESRGRSRSVGTREMIEDLLSPNDFVMDAGNAIMVAKSGVYRLVLPMVKFTRPPPALSEIQLARFDKQQIPGLNLITQLTGNFRD